MLTHPSLKVSTQTNKQTNKYTFFSITVALFCIDVFYIVWLQSYDFVFSPHFFFTIILFQLIKLPILKLQILIFFSTQFIFCLFLAQNRFLFENQDPKMNSCISIFWSVLILKQKSVLSQTKQTANYVIKKYQDSQFQDWMFDLMNKINQ